MSTGVVVTTDRGMNLVTGPIRPVLSITEEAAGDEVIMRYETLAEGFVIPAIGSPVTIPVEDSSVYCAGMWVYITGAGYFQIASLPSGTSLSITNTGNTANALPGTAIATGKNLISGMPIPVSSAPTLPLRLTAFTTEMFVMPAAAASVNIVLDDNTWVAVSMVIYIDGAGWMTVSDVDADGYTITASNPDSTGNASEDDEIAAGAWVVPCALTAAPA